MRVVLAIGLILCSAVGATAQTTPQRIIIGAEVEVVETAVRITITRPSLNFGAVMPNSEIYLDPGYGSARGTPAEILVAGSAGVTVTAELVAGTVRLENNNGDYVLLSPIMTSASCEDGTPSGIPGILLFSDGECRRFRIGGFLRVPNVRPGRYSGTLAINIAIM